MSAACEAAEGGMRRRMEEATSSSRPVLGAAQAPHGRQIHTRPARGRSPAGRPTLKQKLLHRPPFPYLRSLRPGNTHPTRHRGRTSGCPPPVAPRTGRPDARARGWVGGGAARPPEVPSARSREGRGVPSRIVLRCAARAGKVGQGSVSPVEGVGNSSDVRRGGSPSPQGRRIAGRGRGTLRSPAHLRARGGWRRAGGQRSSPTHVSACCSRTQLLPSRLDIYILVEERLTCPACAMSGRRPSSLGPAFEDTRARRVHLAQ